MSLFPRIASPCPYKQNLDDVVVGEWCRMCDRRVVDITDMSDRERIALFSDCSETPCVRYTLPLAAVAATLAMSTAAAAAPADHPRHHDQHMASTPSPTPVVDVAPMRTAGLPAMPPQWDQHVAPPTGTTSKPPAGSDKK